MYNDIEVQLTATDQEKELVLFSNTEEHDRVLEYKIIGTIVTGIIISQYSYLKSLLDIGRLLQIF